MPWPKPPWRLEPAAGFRRNAQANAERYRPDRIAEEYEVLFEEMRKEVG